jgi:hypothetical protein
MLLGPGPVRQEAVEKSLGPNAGHPVGELLQWLRRWSKVVVKGFGAEVILLGGVRRSGLGKGSLMKAKRIHVGAATVALAFLRRFNKMDRKISQNY